MLYDFGHLEMVNAALADLGETMHFSKSPLHRGIVVNDGVKTAVVDTDVLCRNDYPMGFIKAAQRALKEEYRKGALNGVKPNGSKEASYGN